MKKEFKHQKSQISDDKYQWHHPEARTSQNPLRVAEGGDHGEGKKKVPRKGKNPEQILGVSVWEGAEDFSKYLAALGRAIGRAIDNGMRDGLVASINHGKVGRGLADVATYNPSAEANYDSAVNALRIADFPLLAQSTSQKDASIADIMCLLYLEGPAAETPKANQLQAFPNFVPPIPVSDNKVVDTEPHAKASSSLKIIIDQESLETLPKHLATYLSLLLTAVLHVCKNIFLSYVVVSTTAVCGLFVAVVYT
nr:hypothetical protein [Tanacetum cinerariifolium]